MRRPANAEKKVFFRFELSKWLVDNIKYIWKLNSEKNFEKIWKRTVDWLSYLYGLPLLSVFSIPCQKTQIVPVWILSAIRILSEFLWKLYSMSLTLSVICPLIPRLDRSGRLGWSGWKVKTTNQKLDLYEIQHFNQNMFGNNVLR